MNSAQARRIQASLRAEVIAALGMPEEPVDAFATGADYAMTTGELIRELRTYDADEARRIMNDYQLRIDALRVRLAHARGMGENKFRTAKGTR